MAPATRTVQPSYGHAVRVWWAFMWRWPLLTFVPVIPVAILVAIIKKPMGLTPRTLNTFTTIFAWTCMIWAQLATMRHVLRMEFSGFKVRLLETPPEGHE